MSEVEVQLRALVAARLGAREVEVTDDASLGSDLHADSLQLVSLIMEIEAEFQIDIPDEDAVQLATVRQLREYVELAAASKDTQWQPPRATARTARRRQIC